MSGNDYRALASVTGDGNTLWVTDDTTAGTLATSGRLFNVSV